MLWIHKRDGSFEHPKHECKLMDKKIIAILRIYFCLNWRYELYERMFYKICLNVSKPEFAFCDKVGFKPSCSATETNKKVEISLVASLDIILSNKRIIKPCSNYAPGTENGPARGFKILHRLI